MRIQEASLSGKLYTIPLPRGDRKEMGLSPSQNKASDICNQSINFTTLCALDDERHLVFECPALEHVRAARQQLFNVRVGENMQTFMTQKEQHAVLWFVMDCLRYISRQTSDLACCLLVEGMCSFLAFVGLCAFLIHPNKLARLGTWI